MFSRGLQYADDDIEDDDLLVLWLSKKSNFTCHSYRHHYLLQLIPVRGLR